MDTAILPVTGTQPIDDPPACRVVLQEEMKMSADFESKIKKVSETLAPDFADRVEDRLEKARHEADELTGGLFEDKKRTKSKERKASAETGYYGLPLLKQPQWKWEVPLYFFTGGTAGAASLIAGFGQLFRHDPLLVRDARRLAVICGAISPPLLIADLGRRSRFLNMLRVFKPRSPMSVGSWILALFSSSAFTNQIAEKLFPGREMPAKIIRVGSQTISTLAGLPLASYTGVLLGATAVPVWSSSAGELPIHFAASGMGSAVSILELGRHSDSRALNRLGTGSAMAETAFAIRSQFSKNPALAPLKRGKSGWMVRLGALLSGPLPLALRLLAGNSDRAGSRRLRQFAAAATIGGSALTRFAWIAAGKQSARNPALPLQLPQASGE